MSFPCLRDSLIGFFTIVRFCYCKSPTYNTNQARLADRGMIKVFITIYRLGFFSVNYHNDGIKQCRELCMGNEGSQILEQTKTFNCIIIQYRSLHTKHYLGDKNQHAFTLVLNCIYFGNTQITQPAISPSLYNQSILSINLAIINSFPTEAYLSISPSDIMPRSMCLIGVLIE